MSVEIERKFLVRDDSWRALATRASAIRQAYLAAEGRASVRVRIKDAEAATLTIKSRETELRRLELEYPVPMRDAEALMALRAGSVVAKMRHLVPWHDLLWEIDVFEGDNAGLVIAEIELPHEAHALDLPSWVGTEVTGQPQYYNSRLAQCPFAHWPASNKVARDQPA